MRSHNRASVQENKPGPGTGQFSLSTRARADPQHVGVVFGSKPRRAPSNTPVDLSGTDSSNPPSPAESRTNLLVATPVPLLMKAVRTSLIAPRRHASCSPALPRWRYISMVLPGIRAVADGRAWHCSSGTSILAHQRRGPPIRPVAPALDRNHPPDHVEEEKRSCPTAWKTL